MGCPGVGKIRAIMDMSNSEGSIIFEQDFASHHLHAACSMPSFALAEWPVLFFCWIPNFLELLGKSRNENESKAWFKASVS